LRVGQIEGALERLSLCGAGKGVAIGPRSARGALFEFPHAAPAPPPPNRPFCDMAALLQRSRAAIIF